MLFSFPFRKSSFECCEHTQHNWIRRFLETLYRAIKLGAYIIHNMFIFYNTIIP